VSEGSDRRCMVLISIDWGSIALAIDSHASDEVRDRLTASLSLTRGSSRVAPACRQQTPSLLPQVTTTNFDLRHS
jgi:hypothetical protein